MREDIENNSPISATKLPNSVPLKASEVACDAALIRTCPAFSTAECGA
jgi:hypothetical protein